MSKGTEQCCMCSSKSLYLLSRMNMISSFSNLHKNKKQNDGYLGRYNGSGVRAVLLQGNFWVHFCSFSCLYVEQIGWNLPLLAVVSEWTYYHTEGPTLPLSKKNQCYEIWNWYQAAHRVTSCTLEIICLMWPTPVWLSVWIWCVCITELKGRNDRLTVRSLQIWLWYEVSAVIRENYVIFKNKFA